MCLFMDAFHKCCPAMYEEGYCCLTRRTWTLSCTSLKSNDALVLQLERAGCQLQSGDSQSFLLILSITFGNRIACSFSCVQLFSDPMDCSLLGFSVHGMLQARILEWVAMPSSRGSSWRRDRTCVFSLPPTEASKCYSHNYTQTHRAGCQTFTSKPPFLRLNHNKCTDSWGSPSLSTCLQAGKKPRAHAEATCGVLTDIPSWVPAPASISHHDPCEWGSLLMTAMPATICLLSPVNPQDWEI